MAGQPKEVKLDETAVKGVQGRLQEMKGRSDALDVREPSAGMFGQSEKGTTFFAEVTAARTHVKATLSKTSQALADLDTGLTDASNAIKNADEEAERNNRSLHDAVSGMAAPFFSNDGPDKRQDPNELLPVVEKAAQVIRSSVRFV